MSTNTIVQTIGGLRSLRTDARSFLRSALSLDAMVTGANGLAYLALAPVVDGFLGVPAPALYAIGAFLTAFAVGVALTARQEIPHRGATALIIGSNAAWVVASVVVAATGAMSPTTAGTVWTLMQAGTVALFAELQFTGLRKMRDVR